MIEQMFDSDGRPMPAWPDRVTGDALPRWCSISADDVGPSRSSPSGDPPHRLRRRDGARPDPARARRCGGPRDPAPGRRREPPQPPGLRLPPLLAAERRTRRARSTTARVDDRVLRPRHQGDRRHRHGLGRHQGVSERQRRRRDQRGPCQGRPGRPDVPAVRLRQPPEDDGVPQQRLGPGPVHRPGARPHGPPLGRRRELRLRADAGVDDAALPRVPRQVQHRDGRALPRRDARQRDVRRRAALADHAASSRSSTSSS